MSVSTKMTAIADAIRNKTGSTAKLTLDEMASAIDGIEAGIPEGYVKPFGMLTITTNGLYDVINYKTVGVSVELESSGSNEQIQTLGSSGFIQSTAEGRLIYASVYQEGIVTNVVNLSYFSQTKRYRYTMDEAALANTPIIVLTSGTVTMPNVSGYRYYNLANGTGYQVYAYEPENGEEEEVMPDPF